MTKRKLIRHLPRNPHRSPLRHVTRMLHGARRPNHLAVALTAFSRAIRAHRRLIKLAPRLFDYAIVHREEIARLEAEAHRRLWQPALNKAYGLPPDTPFEDPNKDWNSPVPKCPRTLRALEREYEVWQLWMSIGRENMTLFKQRQPHALIGFTQLARLLDIGFTFARLATGLETSAKPKNDFEPPFNQPSIEEAMERIYGRDVSAGPTTQPVTETKISDACL